MIKKLMALCTKRRAAFFVFFILKAGTRPKRRLVDKGLWPDAGSARVFLSREHRYRRRPNSDAQGLIMRRSVEIIGKVEKK
jgi:hypothetical protein